MKRRDFLTAVAATASVPALPARALAGFASVPISPDLLAKATGWVGLWDSCSINALRHRFQIDSETARELAQKLAKAKLLSPPDASGMAQVLNPALKVPLSGAKLETLIDGRAIAAIRKAKGLRDPAKVSASAQTGPNTPAGPTGQTPKANLTDRLLGQEDDETTPKDTPEPYEDSNQISQSPETEPQEVSDEQA